MQTQTSFWQTLIIAIISSSFLSSLLTIWINEWRFKIKADNARAQRILDKVCDVLLAFINEDKSLSSSEIGKMNSIVPRLEGLKKIEAADKLKEIIKTWNLINRYHEEGRDMDEEKERQKFSILVKELAKIRF